MIASLEGRMYPVEVAYLREPTPDYVRTASDVVVDIHCHVGFQNYSLCLACSCSGEQNGPGDVLVFLTGREEIERCFHYLSDVVPRQVYDVSTSIHQ